MVVRWNVRTPTTGTPIARLERAVFALLAHDRHLYIGDEDGGLHRVDLIEQREEHFSRPHTKGIFRFVHLPGHRLVSAGGDGHLGIHRTDGTLRPFRSIPLSADKLRDLLLLPDGRTLCVACGDGSVRWLDTEHFDELHNVAAHPGGVTALAWHPGKPLLATAGKDGHLRFWKAGDTQPLVDLPIHGGTIYGIAFTADGHRFWTVSRDKTCKLWDANSLEPIARIDHMLGGHKRSVNSVVRMGEHVFTCSDDKEVIAWT